MAITDQDPVTKFLHEYDDTVREKCGIVGVYDPEGEAVESAYLAINALQHRGQDGVGVSYIEKPETNFLTETAIRVRKALGRVAVGFRKGEELEGIKSDYATAHVRYGTTETDNPFDALQPLKLEALDQEYTVSHNGQFDMGVITKLAIDEGVDTDGTDSEMFTALLGKNIENYGHIEPALHNLLPKLEGAFSLSILGPEGIYAVRDRHGVRPLVIGNKEGATMFASEICGLKGTDGKNIEQLGFGFVREVDPGTYVVINKNGVRTEQWAKPDKKYCIFEKVYLSKPDNRIDGQIVGDYRYEAGTMLGEMEDVETDMVIPVLGSARYYARGYQEALGVTYSEALRKNPDRTNPDSDRTFIEKTQEAREAAVRNKFIIDAEDVRGKTVTLIDDSLVRGTTTKIIIQMMREAGAKEVHVRIGSNVYSDICQFGVNVQSKDELLSFENTVEGMAKAIGADSLRFLPLEKMHEAAGVEADEVCDGCMGGSYPQHQELPGLPLAMAR